jgi:hypothetical protein
VGSTRKKLIEAAQAMLQGRPENETPLGVLVAQIDNTPELWAENVTAVTLFADMMTQWNTGPGGVVGLRYESLPMVMRAHGTPSAERRQAFDDLRVMERAALEHFRGL